ncbi:hypothetical protein ACFDR9_002774 [Janthinobacterium sp. CG_23.3]|uniref:hypothetical protein n=1 Tax=unclassified Janthinobacterium TaxID=2610881 RepID=UPI002E09CC5D|nr:hypothetical protein [Janthinobacterium sp. CG_S6]
MIRLSVFSSSSSARASRRERMWSLTVSPVKPLNMRWKCHGLMPDSRATAPMAMGGARWPSM